MMLVTHSNEQGDGQGEFVIRIPTLDKRFSVESEEEGKRMALNVIKESGYTGQVTFVRRDGRTYEIEIKPELLVVSKTFWTMVADLKTARIKKTRYKLFSPPRRTRRCTASARWL